MPLNWEHDKQVARAMLGDRRQRRLWLARFLILALAMIVLGMWVIGGWLEQHALFFALWWGACALITLWLMLLALFDALMVIREERKRD